MQIKSQPGKRDRERGGGRKNRALQTELVFLDDSPDYCIENRAQGTVGTIGRICRFFLMLFITLDIGSVCCNDW